jgi:hypothetical protein
MLWPHACVFLLVALSYSPLFFKTFAYGNDYFAFGYDVRNSCAGFPESAHITAIGRPTQSFLLNIQFMLVETMHSFEMLRFLSVLFTSAAASLFMWYVSTYFRIKKLSALVLSVATFTLPEMSIATFWVAPSVAAIAPLFLAIMAHALLQQSSATAVHRTLWFSLSVLINIVGLTIYPPTTFFFLTLTFIKFVFGPKESESLKYRELFLEVGVLFVASIFYGFVLLFLWRPFLIKTRLWGLDFQSFFAELDSDSRLIPYRAALSFNIINKVESIRELLILVFSAWFPPGHWRSFAVFAPCCGLALAWASASSPYLRGCAVLTRAMLGVCIACLAVIAPAAPVLAGSGRFPILYHVIFASAAVVPIALAFALDRALQAGRNLRLALPIGAAVALFLLAGEASAFYRLKFQADRLSLEYQHVASAVQQSVDAGSSIIMVPPLTPPLDPHGFLSHDFGYTSVTYVAREMATAALRDLGENPGGYSVVYDLLGPRYAASLQEGIVFSRAGYPNFVSGVKGISGREDFGRWTDSGEAVIEFLQPLPQRFTLKITAGASTEALGKWVEVIVGDCHRRVRFERQTPSEAIVSVVTDGQASAIILQLPGVKSPRELGVSEDARRLGLALVSLRIEQ